MVSGLGGGGVDWSRTACLPSCRCCRSFLALLTMGSWRGGGGGAVEGSAVTTSAEVHRDAFLVLGHQ